MRATRCRWRPSRWTWRKMQRWRRPSERWRKSLVTWPNMESCVERPGVPRVVKCGEGVFSFGQAFVEVLNFLGGSLFSHLSYSMFLWQGMLWHGPKLLHRRGCIDCLFNNAGYQGLFAPVDDYSVDDFEKASFSKTIWWRSTKHTIQDPSLNMSFATQPSWWENGEGPWPQWSWVEVT